MIRAILVIFVFFLAFAGCTTKEQAANELYKESLKLIEKNEMAAAEKKLDEALELDDRNKSVLMAKLELYSKLQDMHKFKNTAEILFVYDLLNDDTINNVSESYLAKGNKVEALNFLSCGRSDENIAAFDRVANEMAKEGKIGRNLGLGVNEYYELLTNHYGKHGDTTAIGASLYQLLDLVDYKKDAKLAKELTVFASDKLSLLETGIDMDTLEATASGYRLAASYALSEYKSINELIDHANEMNFKTSSVQKLVSDGKISMGSDETRKEIFFHRAVSLRLTELQKSK